jgi:tetratricopeptide (TPR) repeat protein
MKTDKIFVIIGSTLILPALCLTGARAGTIPPEFVPVYETLRDAVYQNAPIAEIRNHYKTADSLRTKVIKDKKDNSYWSGRLEYLAGRAENELQNWKEADAHLAIGLKAIDEHMRTCSCDEGWRVKSAIMGQMCLVKIRQMEYWWVFMHGLEVSYLANTALKIQPRNGKAHILIASTLVYPPVLYGGNPSKGIEVMNTALEMPDIEKDDLFNIFSGLGIAYGRLERREEALAYLNKALELYPGNRYAAEKLKEIASGQHVNP